ncbi:MAG: MbcA/ParS/Xre antitoxin family protein [Janthinobacterium lividum]
MDTPAYAHPGEGRSEAPIAMHAFQALAEAWQLSTDDQVKLLGTPGRSTFFKWKKDGGSIPRDTQERISHLLAIYKALQIIVPDPARADSWVKAPNQFFAGRTALEVMLEGQFVDIVSVRQYVDAQRGG